MGVTLVGKLLLRMALPLVISMLVQALYNVVDGIYIACYSQSAATVSMTVSLLFFARIYRQKIKPII